MRFFRALILLTAAPCFVAAQSSELPKPVLEKLAPDAIAQQDAVSEAADAGPQNLSAGAIAVWKFVVESAEKYRIAKDGSNIRLEEEKASLRGKHFYFQQTLGGIPVEGATLVASTNKKGQITRVYTSMVPVTVDKVARVGKASIDEETAYDKAWQALGAKINENGQGLYGEPKANLSYIASQTGFRLTYAVDLYCNRKQANVENAKNEPGSWRVRIDAVSGETIGDPVRLSTDHRGSEPTYDKRAGDRVAAFQQYFRLDKETSANRLETAETGSALVFDPDPATTLKSATLSDSSPAMDFSGAYLNVDLLEISKRDGKFVLEGPWVQLDDFELPSKSPSTTTDGKWTAERGDDAFNDAMTYFHIDRSQRYIQSLGFENIQHAPIRVDANGVNEADNSHFIPSANVLAFGHGCVDDNEDADVILHEYGHAITHSINSQWFGGDSGAIGEGFGDYWAETASFASPNGPVFQPDRTFDWDASSGCWSGRRLNVKPSDVTYDPERNYSAHESIGGGVVSDELWATPLYQAHVELRGKSIPREEIDKIVLESMFGIGSNFTMRDLAKNVVDVSNDLFPDGPHAEVFEKHFKSLKILE